ncbi:MAG: hypothetical protein JWQ74_500 [Marmoricola sp.]|nr:hypothetical protein [Marmoricola sp.]
MTDQTPPPHDPTVPPPAYQPPPPPAYQPPPPAYGQPPVGYVAPAAGPIGKVRSTGVCFLLMVVTFGIYSLFWYGNTQGEMKRHSGRGLGGPVSVLLAFFVGFVMPFFSSGEVGDLQAGAGREKTVQGTTGLWILLPFVGSIIWFVKTNGALNDYWRSLGATS